jgi:hypothetical protein
MVPSLSLGSAVPVPRCPVHRTPPTADDGYHITLESGIVEDRRITSRADHRSSGDCEDRSASVPPHEVLLYHHIQGLTDGMRAFADSSLEAFDEDAASLLRERVPSFLGRL